MNLKKMATWLWKSGPHLKQVGFLLVILANTIKQTPTFRLKHGSLSSVWNPAGKSAGFLCFGILVNNTGRKSN
ncbi:MAG: hypothetical protein BAA01_12210 [Bacillus thermozeamaize]|uniref:Uncharacterized protein n=1 Tax=Bacillus thermozeamaize TaxID=230954 RepID=A0A1Y3PIU5_9BACI|nr:MAG: hypothetical protein BAA01_12210 [Bacillus thermozeamaize]